MHAATLPSGAHGPGPAGRGRPARAEPAASPPRTRCPPGSCGRPTSAAASRSSPRATTPWSASPTPSRRATPGRCSCSRAGSRSTRRIAAAGSASGSSSRSAARRSRSATRASAGRPTRSTAARCACTSRAWARGSPGTAPALHDGLRADPGHPQDDLDIVWHLAGAPRARPADVRQVELPWSVGAERAASARASARRCRRCSPTATSARASSSIATARRCRVSFARDAAHERLRHGGRRRLGGAGLPARRAVGRPADSSRSEHEFVWRGLERVLAVLERFGARATFYVPGVTVEEDPGVVPRDRRRRARDRPPRLRASADAARSSRRPSARSSTAGSTRSHGSAWRPAATARPAGS